jgi:CRISPR-associated endoribonuclease Cas6
MLLRSTWLLTVTEPVLLPRSYPIALSKQLHERIGLSFSGEAIPPVTFSGIVGSVSVAGDFLCYSPGNIYSLSLSGLDTSIAKAIAAHDLGETLEFFGARFQVGDRADLATTYEDLYTESVARDPEPIREYRLDFLTPTAFAQGHTNLPLPVPALLFRSWLEKWNHFSTIYLGGDELIGYLSDRVSLRHHRLQTRRIFIHQSTVTGFTGQITLQVPRQVDPLLANVANLLVRYADYAGTGIKTRLGMGYTVKRDKSNKKANHEVACNT